MVLAEHAHWFLLLRRVITALMPERVVIELLDRDLSLYTLGGHSASSFVLDSHVFWCVNFGRRYHLPCRRLPTQLARSCATSRPHLHIAQRRCCAMCLAAAFPDFRLDTARAGRWRYSRTWGT